MSSYMDQMNQMMQPQEGQIDDYDAAFDAIEEREGQHAKDVPQDWDTANPYAVDQGVPHGSGYENEGAMDGGMAAAGGMELGMGGIPGMGGGGMPAPDAGGGGMQPTGAPGM